MSARGLVALGAVVLAFTAVAGQRACTDDQYQTALLVTQCKQNYFLFKEGQVPAIFIGQEEEVLVRGLPGYQLWIQVFFDLDVDMNISVWDDTNEHCIVGTGCPQEVVWTKDGEQFTASVDYEGMTFKVQTSAQWVSLHSPSLPQEVLDRPVSIRAMSTRKSGFSQLHYVTATDVTGTGSGGGQSDHCPPPCANCSAYSKCAWGQTPACNGTTDVRCESSTSTSSSTTWSTSTTTFTTSTTWTSTTWTSTTSTWTSTTSATSTTATSTRTTTSQSSSTTTSSTATTTGTISTLTATTSSKTTVTRTTVTRSTSTLTAITSTVTTVTLTTSTTRTTMTTTSTTKTTWTSTSTTSMSSSTSTSSSSTTVTTVTTSTSTWTTSTASTSTRTTSTTTTVTTSSSTSTTSTRTTISKTSTETSSSSTTSTASTSTGSTSSTTSFTSTATTVSATTSTLSTSTASTSTLTSSTSSTKTTVSTSTTSTTWSTTTSTSNSTTTTSTTETTSTSTTTSNTTTTTSTTTSSSSSSTLSTTTTTLVPCDPGDYYAVSRSCTGHWSSCTSNCEPCSWYSGCGSLQTPICNGSSAVVCKSPFALVEAGTALWPGAATTAAATLSLEVDGTWEPPELFFDSATTGQVFNLSLPVASWPTRLQFSLNTSDAWGIQWLRFSVGPRMQYVLQSMSPQGAPFKVEPHWVGNGSFARTYTVPQEVGVRVDMFIRGVSFATLQGNQSLQSLFVEALQESVIAEAGRFVPGDLASTRLSEGASGVFAEVTLPAELPLAASAWLLLSAALAAPGERALQGIETISELERALSAETALLSINTVPGLELFAENVSVSLLPEASGVLLEMALDTDLHFSSQVQSNQSARDELEAAARQEIAASAGRPLSQVLVTASHDPSVAGRVWVDALLPMEPALAAAVLVSLHSKLAGAVPVSVLRLLPPGSSGSSSSRAIPEAASGAWVELRLDSAPLAPMADDLNLWAALEQVLTDAVARGAERPVAALSTSLVQGHDNAWYLDGYIAAEPALGAAISLQLSSASLGSSVLNSARALPALAPLLPSDAALAARAELVPEARGFLASTELLGFDFGELESSPEKKERFLRAAESALLQALGRPLSGSVVNNGIMTSSLSQIPGGVLVDTLLSCDLAVAAALLTAVRAASADVGNAVLAAASAVPGVRLPGAPASHARLAANLVPKATGVALQLGVENVHLEALHDAGRAALHAAIREAMTLHVGGPFAAELLSTSLSARPGGGLFLDAFLHAELPLAATMRSSLQDASEAMSHAVQSAVRTVAVGAGSIPSENVAIELVPEARGVAVRTVLEGSGAGAALQNATFRKKLLLSFEEALRAHAGRHFQEQPSHSVSQGANGAVYVDTLIPAEELALSAVILEGLQDSMVRVARETLAGLAAGDTRIDAMAPFLVPPSKVQGVSIKVLMPDLDPASLSGSGKDSLQEVLGAALLNATGRATSGHVLSTSLSPLGGGVVFDALVTAEPALAAALFAALQRNVSSGLGREVAHRVRDATQLAVAAPSIAARLIPQARGLSVSLLIKGVNETELQSNGVSRAAFVSVVHNALLASAEREVLGGALQTELSSSKEGLRVDTFISTEPGLAAALRAKLLNASATLSAEVIRGAMGVKGVAAPSKVTAEGLGAELVPQATGVWLEMQMGGLGAPMSRSVRTLLLQVFETAVAKHSGRRLPSNASVVITQAPNGTAFLDCFLPVPSGYSNAASIAASLGSSSAALAAEVSAGVEGLAAESALVRLVPEVTGVHLAFPVTEAVAAVLRGSPSKSADLQAALAEALKELENIASTDGWATGFSEATGGGESHVTLFVPKEPRAAAELRKALINKYALFMQLVKGKAQAVGADTAGIGDALITLVPQQATSPQATTTKAHAEATSGKPTTTDMATTTTLQDAEAATTSVGREEVSTSTSTTTQAWVLSSWGVCLPTACGSGLRSRIVSCPGDGIHCNLTATPPWQEVCHDESMCCDSPFFLFPETGWFDCSVQHWFIVILLLLLLLCCCSCLVFLICFRLQKRMGFRRYELEKTQVTETHEAREISIQADETTLPWEARVICPAPEKPVPSVSEAPMELKEEVLGPMEIIQVIGEPPGHFEVVKVGPSGDPGLCSVLPIDRPPRQDGSRGHRDPLWDIPNEAILQATIPIGQQVRVPSRDPSRKRRSGDPRWEQAMSTVDRTTRELSRLMADARAAPRRRKPELFQKMRELENDPEYVQAKHYLEEDGKIETGKGVLNFCCGVPVADQLARHAGPSPRTFSNLQAVCSEASACSDATAFLGMEDDLFNGNRQDYAMAL